MNPFEYIAVVTAKSVSTRLPDKNVLPFNGTALAEWSIIHARQAGLPVVLVTNSPIIKRAGSRHNVTCIQHPSEDEGLTHKEVVEMAVKEAGYEGSHVVLLQPTSPFRLNNIVEKCVNIHRKNPERTVATAMPINNWPVEGGGDGAEQTILRGNTIVYNKDRLFDHSNILPVQTEWVNLLEVDTAHDYVQACTLAKQMRTVSPPVDVSHAVEAFQQLGFVNRPCSLVVRDKGEGEPDQENLVAYVNHCRGYNGGRCDIVFTVINENLFRNLNDEFRQCLKKAKVVVYRQGVYLEQFKKTFKDELADTVLAPIPDISEESTFTTTGVMALSTLDSAGLRVTKYGFTSAEDRAMQWATHPVAHQTGLYYDVAILNTVGEYPHESTV
jgi:CTP:molybdopterin cytidylyltransferase MocA